MSVVNSTLDAGYSTPAVRGRRHLAASAKPPASERTELSMFGFCQRPALDCSAE
jgi:hypothetical protein